MADLSDSPLIPEDKEVDPTKLRVALISHFNVDELRTLCFDLEIDYEDLPPGGKSSKARSLVEYSQRHHRFNVLAIAIREARSGISWEDLTGEKEKHPTAAETAPSQVGTETFIATRSVAALIKLMGAPDVREAASAFRTDFKAASAQIALMNDYKLIHDLFQELENRYFLIYNDQKRLPADEMAWDSIELNEPEVRGKIDDLLQAVQLASFANKEARWTQQLEKVQEDIRAGVENYDFNALKSGTRLLYRILNRQISRINAQLVSSAKALRLDAIEQAMATISASLAQADYSHETIGEIQDGVDALAGLNTRVMNLVQEHNAWQELDDELRRVEGALNMGMEELKDAWFDLEPMAQNLYNGQTDKWAVALAQVCDSLSQALEGGTDIAIRRYFRRFRSQEGRRFRQVDFDLLSLVQELQEVGESLEVLLMLRSFK
ncbi:MAG: hypothetical protein GY803_19905 [Chloroflexi bacterium]|nr:hypothetical protein [Chloroflexota bacterium]